MPLSVKQGNFAQPTTTGNYSVTDVGFQPKALILWGTQLTSDGISSNCFVFRGVSLSTTKRYAISFIGHTNGDNYHRFEEKSVLYINEAQNVIVRAEFVSMDSSGFTLNFTTVDSTARIIHYIALGGSDITNVNAGYFLSPTTTGNQTITGVGFQADNLIFFGNSSGFNITDGWIQPFFGSGINSSNQWAVAGSRATLYAVDRAQRTDQVIINTSSSASFDHLASLVSTNSDGFTLNWTSVSSYQIYIIYFAIKGGQFKVGSFNQATSTGNQSITGVGFQPSLVLFAGFNAAASTSALINLNQFSGCAESSSSRHANAFGASDVGVNTSLIRTRCIRHITPGTNPTINSEADFVSHDTNGFTINNTTVDTTARHIVYWAIGSQPVQVPSLDGWYFQTTNPYPEKADVVSY